MFAQSAGRRSHGAALPILVALGLLLSLLGTGPADAVVDDGPRDADAGGLAIVVFTDPPLAAYEGGIGDLAPTNPEVTGEPRLDTTSPASVAYLGYLATRRAEIVAAMEAAVGHSLEVVHAYDAVLNGVAVELSAAERETVAGVPGVSRVRPDELRFLQTDHGPEWIGAPSIWGGEGTAGAAGTFGEEVVIGVIDTGVNHDHPSFADVGGDGFDHTNPRGRFFGACDPVTGAPFCNDKLIGVHDFTGSTPEDTNGHGSHTASTAAGNLLDAEMVAPTITFERSISGVAPHANLITYKACPAINCLITAILAGINQATLDMVDVINYSIGGASNNPWDDPDAQAFLNARRAGIFVASSAGNDGPGAQTVGSPADAPWILAVGASTHDRKFLNSLVDMTGGATAPPADIEGKGITAGHGPAPIVYAGDFGDPLCQTPFPPDTWTNDEIVICDRGVNPRVAKAENVAIGGAGGFVLANEEESGDSTVADAYVIPGVNITFNDGVTLKAWVGDGGSDHTATISGTVFDENVEHGDVMGAFSSRGPNASVPDVLKPDVTAPGVDIFAAWMTTNPLAPPEYNVISGTSMSSPHAAGSAALLRALYPEFSPDEVRSALMTTGFTILPGSGREVHDVLKEDAATQADPFDYGNGRVDLTQAGQIGLVLDETAAGYDAANPAFGGEPKDLNLASLADGECPGICTWERTLEATTHGAGTWTASVAAPSGMAVSVEPNTFTLEEGETQTISVSADVRGMTIDAWHFARIFLVHDGDAPDAELQLAAFARPGDGEVEQTVLHFHGNPGEHDSGEPDEANCTGNGTVDVTLETCGGPFLLESDELSPETAASFGPSTVLLNCTVDRCPVDPNWVWNLPGTTTLSGPMTVEWWYGCPGCELLFFEDFFIRLWADGELVLEERVRHTQLLPAAPVRLADTITVPEVTADETFVLHIDPIFINQEDSIVWYDSTEPCPGGTFAPCDSLVRMPVVAEPELADLTISDMSASDARPREGKTITLTAVVTNDGDGAADASATEFVLETDGSVIGVAEAPALDPGESAEVSVSWDTRGLNGEHTIRATADIAGAVTESDETNNVGSLTVTVRGTRVENGSFETANADGSGPEAWTGSDTDAGTTSWSDGGSHGERSVTITGTGGSAVEAGVPTWTSEPMAVEAGEVLTLVASVRTEGLSSAPTVGLAYLGPVARVLETVAVLSAPLTSDGFELLEETVTVPAGVAEVRVVLSGFAVTDLATAGSVTFDDVGLFAD